VYITGEQQRQLQPYAKLQVQLCSPPVPPLCIVPDGIVSPESDPLRNGTILLGLLGQLLLDLERLLGRLHRNKSQDVCRKRNWASSTSAGRDMALEISLGQFSG